MQAFYNSHNPSGQIQHCQHFAAFTLSRSRFIPTLYLYNHILTLYPYACYDCDFYGTFESCRLQGALRLTPACLSEGQEHSLISSGASSFYYLISLHMQILPVLRYMHTRLYTFTDINVFLKGENVYFPFYTFWNSDFFFFLRS